MDSYHQIPQYPDDVSGTTVLVRLLGLSNDDYRFRPAPDCMSIEEIVRHVWGLVNWVSKAIGLNGFSKKDNISLARGSILEMTYALRNVLNSMSDDNLKGITIDGRSFWHIINGPISDALTHVGQINSFRRLAGNPTPKANVFVGSPPRD
jgi:hypothetical protein